jgi:hypothetical protein
VFIFSILKNHHFYFFVVNSIRRQKKSVKTKNQKKMSQQQRQGQRTPCEKFITRLLGNWQGIGDTEGWNKNLFMSMLTVAHNPREPSNVGSAVVRSHTKDPDERIATNYGGYIKCTSDTELTFVMHHQLGTVEIVKGKVDNEEGSAATLESEDRESTGNVKYVATKHHWYFGKRSTEDEKGATASLRRGLNSSAESQYTDFDDLNRHYYVATTVNPRFELLQRTKYFQSGHYGGGGTHGQKQNLSANAAYY